jgi:3',5'-cyclic AMP phosphodiesterase CpdA
MSLLRFLHYSDVHLTVPKLGWRPRDVLSKKSIGWVNVKFLGRGRRFRHATTVADAMISDARKRGHDAILFSGDATKLAFEPEFAFAAERLGVGASDLPLTVAIPGNHDYYTRRDERSGVFERYFAPWLQGERIGEHQYPFARRVGHIWLVCVNSSYPQRWNTTASRMIGPSQLERLVMLARALPPGPRILITHYPLRDSHGRIEQRSHRLLDHRLALAAAKEAGIGLWLHGHIHKPFVLRPGHEIPFPVICAGSSTQTHRWAHNEYVIDGTKLTMTRRVWNPDEGEFQPERPIVFDLASG